MQLMHSNLSCRTRHNLTILFMLCCLWFSHGPRFNKLFKGDNPFEFVKRYPKVKHKKKLPDNKRDEILDYCSGKAFDYNPHFLLLVAMVLYTGFRGNELYALRWTEPTTDEEK